MVHWASEKVDELQSAVNETGWNLSIANTDDGPIEFVHDDGSEISFVSSSISGNYAVEYQSSESSKSAVTDEHVSYVQLNDAIEWVVHILSRHEKVN